MSNLNIKAYKDDIVVSFIDADGCYCDFVCVRNYGGQITVNWGLPANKSIANAELHMEAMSMALAIAKVIEQGGRVEVNEWRL